MYFPTFPLKRGRLFEFLVKWPETAVNSRCEASGEGALNQTAGKPFFNILTDNGIAALFLEAVTANPDEALAFVSKHYANAIDMDALRDILGERGSHKQCRLLVKASYMNDPKNCMTRSVLVVDPVRNSRRLVHLHMIKEPDRYGQWKIYGVEQE